jgi:hypothetical protein
MINTKKQGQTGWTRRGVLGLLGVLLGSRGLVWSSSISAKPKLSQREANYYRTYSGGGEK